MWYTYKRNKFREGLSFRVSDIMMARKIFNTAKIIARHMKNMTDVAEKWPMLQIVLTFVVNSY